MDAPITVSPARASTNTLSGDAASAARYARS
ncbi:hypothetical protein AZ54_16935 [Xanthomonas oryzae pv. oryzae PXO86]|nr:hypothetical protein AZ54_16935 [Xanthomonas oryzae pv. oryzae PXO86]